MLNQQIHSCFVAGEWPLNVESTDDLREENRRLSRRLDELERLHVDDVQTIARIEAELHALRLYNAIPDVGVKRHDFLASWK
jgi:hypothetical protein